MFLTKPYRVLVAIYSGNPSSITELTASAKVYAFDNIIADTTSITQDDETRNETDCETRDEPIYESITLGKWNFTCDSTDFRPGFLTDILGFTKPSSSTTDRYLAPTSYKKIYAAIEIQFSDPTDKEHYEGSVLLPKVLLSSKAIFESLKTSLAKITVAGTAYSADTGSGVSPLAISFAPFLEVSSGGGPQQQTLSDGPGLID